MNKAELRREFLSLRRALTATEVSHRSQLIADHFVDFLAKSCLRDSPAIIHTFLPIRRQHEVDTWLIIRQLWASLKQLSVAVPVTDVTQNTLHHHWLGAETVLIENQWGIPEPATNGQLAIPDSQIDLVLVPLLTFDQQGHRIGYGGGFYDRFLANCRPDCLKVGLSLFDPVDRIDGIELTDIKLNACITPKGLYSFN